MKFNQFERIAFRSALAKFSFDTVPAVPTTATGVSRHPIKDKLRELVDRGLAGLHGKGRGAHYRLKDR